MKKEFGLALMAFLFLSLNALPELMHSKKREGCSTLLQQESDISGDGKNDIVRFQGFRLRKESLILRKYIYMSPFLTVRPIK